MFTKVEKKVTKLFRTNVCDFFFYYVGRGNVDGGVGVGFGEVEFERVLGSVFEVTCSIPK